MKSLLTAFLCLAAVAIAPAAEIPNKFAGRWAGIAEFGQSKNPDQIGGRALLTFEVNADGSITNGAIRDFAGYGLAYFSGQLDANGRFNSGVFGVPAERITVLKINLNRTTGTGIYRSYIPGVLSYRTTIRLWREQKPMRGNGEHDKNSVSDAIAQTTVSGYTNDAEPHFLPLSPNPAANP